MVTKAPHANQVWSEPSLSESNSDRAAMLESENRTEIDAAILAIATEKMQMSGLMEWPEIKRADPKKTISFWVQNGECWKTQGNTHVETYYCPLRNRCDCRAQLHITHSSASIVLD
jgi:hypothetical protein